MKYSYTGFTLIEVMLYVTILGVVMTLLVQSTWNVLDINTFSNQQTNSYYVDRLLRERMTLAIRESSELLSLNSDSICIALEDSPMNPLGFYFSDATVTMRWGGGGTDCNTAIGSDVVMGIQTPVEAFTIAAMDSGDSGHYTVNISYIINGRERRFSASPRVAP